MELTELLPIILSLFFALENWNLEMSNYRQADNQEQTVSEIIIDLGVTKIKSFWLTNVTLLASAIDCSDR